jgi:hypothetical protein
LRLVPAVTSLPFAGLEPPSVLRAEERVPAIVDASEGLDRWEKFREADFKSLLKKIARAAVEDAKALNDDN